jgi:hypothetical protein
MEDPTCTVTIGKGVVCLRFAEGLVFEAESCHDATTKLAVTRLDRLVTEYPEACEKEDFALLGALLFQILFGGRATQILNFADNTPSSKELGETLGDIFIRHFESFMQQCADLAGPNGKDPDRRFRINLLFKQDVDELARYPWEFLYVSRPNKKGFFVAGEETRLILTRIVPPTLQTVVPDTPVVLWIAWAQPGELGELLNIEDLAAQIESKLGRNMPVQTRLFPNISWDDFKEEFNKPGSRPPDIIHFVGHGQFVQGKSQVAFKRTSAQMNLARAKAVSNTNVGEAHWLDVGDLSAELKDRAPWLFFLHTCNTGRAGANVEAFRSAAQQLAQADVPFVIAMQYEIANDDARCFAEEFYDKLGAGQSIDDAVKAGRTRLGTQSPAWGHRRFATPVVYLRSAAQVLVPLPRAASAAQFPESTQKPCPYPNCARQVDTELKRCTCERRKPLRYCARGHPNEESALECRYRDCPERFDGPATPARPGSTPAASPTGLGVA